MPLQRFHGCLAPEDVERAWLLTFEYAGVASLGGLGNAVRRFAEGLLELGVKVTVITPSHGRHFDEGFARSVNLRAMSVVAEGDRIGLMKLGAPGRGLRKGSRAFHPAAPQTPHPTNPPSHKASKPSS